MLTLQHLKAEHAERFRHMNNNQLKEVKLKYSYARGGSLEHDLFKLADHILNVRSGIVSNRETFFSTLN